MKKTPVFIAAMACSFTTLAPLAVLASTDVDATTAQPQVENKDSSIKSSIKAQFATETHNGVGLSQIDVDVNHHGVVSLEGRVASQDAADRAVSIARATDGVREVKNQLKIKTDD
jgi:hyperosmotically inducible periplasmic protein